MKIVKKDYSKRELLEAASAFHGHTGPFLVLGLKAGEIAEKYLGHEPFRIRCEVYCEPKPPQSCIVDGIQFSTSCTMGKGNITMLGSGSMKIIFRSGSAAVEITPRDEVIRMIREAAREEEDELSERLYGMPPEGIFSVKKM